MPALLNADKPWGWPGAVSPGAVKMANRIAAGFGLSDLATVPQTPPTLPPPRAAIVADLPNLCKGKNIQWSIDAETRLRSSFGASLRDVLRTANATVGTLQASDAVVYPGSEADVQAVLAWASKNKVAVVPYGGGTSVTSGLEPSPANIECLNGHVALHLGRMDKVLSINSIDRTAVVQAGVSGPKLEAALKPHGLTARFFPQSFSHSTVGGWIATRAAGHFCTGPTHIDDVVQAVRLATPSGIISTARLPSSGAGPDPKRLILGSEGSLGVLTEAVIRVQRVPASRCDALYDFPLGLLSAAEAARVIVQAGLLPANLRAVDEQEAMTMGLGNGSDAVLIVSFESQLESQGVVEAQMAAARALAEGAGGTARARVDAKKDRGGTAANPGTREWKASFTTAPEARDEIVMRGMLVETFETACTWSKLRALHEAVNAALHAVAEARGLSLLVWCRITHVYVDGCAPYFTVACIEPFDSPAQMLEAWDGLKDAANGAIHEHGAAASHHHAVGRDHLGNFATEVGPLFVAGLAALKRVFDPRGIMNPGALGVAAAGQASEGPRSRL